MRVDRDLPGALGSADALVHFEQDVRGAAGVGRVMDDGAEHEFVADVGKRRHGRLDHDRLVDFESGFAGAELALLRGRDRDDAVTREAVRRLELRARAALRIGAHGRVPERRRDEVRAQPIEERGPAFAIPDEVAFVCEIGFGGVFAKQGGQSEAGGNAEAARLIEEREWIGRCVGGEAEDAFVHRIQNQLGVGRRFAAGVFHFRFQFNGVARLGGRTGRLDRDRELLLRLRDFQVGVADAVLGCFYFARTLVRAAQEHDGNEDVRPVGLRDRDLDGRCVAG